VNTQIVFLFILLLALSVGSTIGASIRSVRQFPGYLAYETKPVLFSGFSLQNNGTLWNRTPWEDEVRPTLL
jgi:hypothetical protein